MYCMQELLLDQYGIICHKYKHTQKSQYVMFNTHKNKYEWSLPKIRAQKVLILLMGPIGKVIFYGFMNIGFVMLLCP